MPPPPTGIGGSVMFSSCPSVSACRCVRPFVVSFSPISYKPVDGISPLVDDLVKATDELIGF